jgi:hypothetical protein
MTDGPDLFDGCERPAVNTGDGSVFQNETTIGGEMAIDPEQMAIDALRKGLEQLTYRDSYAFGAGFVPLFLGLVLGFDPLLSLAVPLMIVALGCSRCTPIVGGRVAEWVIQRPHYLFLGQFVATFLGGLVLVILRMVGFTAGLVA